MARSNILEAIQEYQGSNNNNHNKRPTLYDYIGWEKAVPDPLPTYGMSSKFYAEEEEINY